MRAWCGKDRQGRECEAYVPDPLVGRLRRSSPRVGGAAGHPKHVRAHEKVRATRSLLGRQYAVRVRFALELGGEAASSRRRRLGAVRGPGPPLSGSDPGDQDAIVLRPQVLHGGLACTPAIPAYSGRLRVRVVDRRLVIAVTGVEQRQGELVIVGPIGGALCTAPADSVYGVCGHAADAPQESQELLKYRRCADLKWLTSGCPSRRTRRSAG